MTLKAGGIASARALGILGGTFDPVHEGHLALAREAMRELDLEQVLFVPNADPPHKQDQAVTPAPLREAMVALAIDDAPGLVLSRIELDRPGPSYAVDTVAELAARSQREGRPEPWFILSAEVLAEFATWREPQRILELCRIAVAPRPGAETLDVGWVATHYPGSEDRFAFLPGPELDITSTGIRTQLATGRSVVDVVPRPVADYIREQGLYGRDEQASPDDERATGDPQEKGAMMDEEQQPKQIVPSMVVEPSMSVSADADAAERPRTGLPTRRGPGAAEARPRETIVPGEVDEPVLALAHRIVELAADKKASDIVLLDVRGQTTMTDYFVICSGASDRQLGAIAAGITEGAKENGDAPLSREGDAGSHWLLIDFGGVIVHVMSVPEREYYQLEQLWSDAALLLHIL